MCVQHLPAFFFKDYGDRFQKFVLLQGPSGQVWPVNLCVSCGSTTGRPTVRFSRGWKEFANDHQLELGDKLIFTLASFSRFSVQVFDPQGKKKPTSSDAVSGWSFRREEVQDDETSRQKKSIFVNWQNKVVRESSVALGSNVERPRKGKVAGSGQASRVAILCRHLKRENTTLERSNALVAKFRTRKPAKSLPLSLFVQKWSNRSGNASFPDSKTLFNLNDEQADDATNLLEWEPLETASPSQLWPVALTSNDPSKPQAENILSIPSGPSPPPHRARADREQGNRSSNFTDQEEDDDDPLQAYWKHKKRKAISVPWPTEEILDRNAKPSIRTRVLKVRPITAMEAPKEIEPVYTPSSPTLISLVHCLQPSSRQVHSHHGQDSRQSENRGPRTGSCSDFSNFVSEDLRPQACHAQNALAQAQGISNLFKQSNVRIQKFTNWNRVPSKEKREELCAVKAASACNPFKDEAEINSPSSDSELEMHIPLKTPHVVSKSTPSRSDLSHAYFLHQPRPTARRQGQDEESAAADQYSSGGKCINAKGSTSGSVPEFSLQKSQKIVTIANASQNVPVSVLKPQDASPSEKHSSEQTGGVEMAIQMPQCPATKTARSYVDEDFNIRTTSRECTESNIPSLSPVSIGPLVVFNSSVIAMGFPDKFDYPPQKELALACKRSCKENLKSHTLTKRTEDRAAGSVLAERNPNYQKTSPPIPSLCTISPPTYECKPVLTCRKDVGITEYLEQKRVARKPRPRVKKGTNDAQSQRKDVPTTERDVKPCIHDSSKFKLDSSSKKRAQTNVLVDSRATSAPQKDKVRKLGGTFNLNLMERAQTPHTKSSKGNRCDLVELDGIASDEDASGDPMGGDTIFEVEESWDTWREIIQQRDVATSLHLRRP